MTMPAPVISFVIPVRDDAVRLRRCLESIRADRSNVPSELIVADNGSTDDSAATAREIGATVVDLPDRVVADVRNAAARSANGALLAFIDADHTLSSGWTDAAAALFDVSSVWAAGAQYHAPADGTWVQRMYDNLRSRSPETEAVDWLPSGNLIVRRTAFDRIGGFDARLESCEDVDFCRRLREAGGTLLASDKLHSVHHGDPRSLRALFLAELWRGRDNLRVSLRDRLTLRSGIGLAIPIVHLLALVGLLLGVATAALGGLAIAAASGAVLVALTLFRTVLLLSRMPHGRWQPGHVLHAVLVAATYDTARALALVVRVGHDVRRKGGR